MPCTSGGIFFSRVSRTAALLLRMVPVISTVSGMILAAEPALSVPTLITPMPCDRSARRLTRGCRPSMMAALATTGSTPLQGAEPWVCWPLTMRRKPSLLLSTVPAL